MSTSVIIKLLLILILSTASYGQWSPTGGLARIPIYENCSIAGGRIGISIISPPPRRIYMCQQDINGLNRFYPGAGHFFYVHEFGHQAINSGNEPATDCWASEQLAFTNNGKYYIGAAIRFFYDRGNEYHPAYGSGFDRARRLYNCAERVSVRRSISRNGATIKNILPEKLPSLERIASEGFENAELEITKYDFESGLKFLLEASLSQFISLRGEEVPGTKNSSKKYQGLTKLKGFETCLTQGVAIGYESASYQCSSNISPKNTQTTFNQSISKIKALKLNSWKTISEENRLYQISEGDGKRSITVTVTKGDNGSDIISLWITSPQQEIKNSLRNILN